MSHERVIFYADPQTDDFAGTSITARRIGEDFPYIHRSALWNLLAFLFYYVVAVPIVFAVSKLYLGLRIENRQVLRSLRGTGFYLYGNHTRVLDAFVPAMASFPKKAYIIADPDAVSLPLLGNVVQMLGAIPIPNEFSGMRRFMEAVYTRSAGKNCVAIFPEAHIWPFYTGIRPFPATSFRYPAKDGRPVVAMVTTYRKRRGLFFWVKKPAMTVALSDPIYPALGSSPKAVQAELHDRVYSFMTEISGRKENVEYIRYVQKSGCTADDYG